MKTFQVENPKTAAHQAAMAAAVNTGTSKLVDDDNEDAVTVSDWNGTLLALFVKA